jgi:hypothetical protein
MKFDVVIGNPPYSSKAKENNNSRVPGDNLAKKFTIKAIDLCTDYMAFIIPYSGRNYSASMSEYYRRHGLYKITKTSFKGVEQTIGIYFFNRLKIVNIIQDEFISELIVSENNITKYYRTDTGSISRNQYEHLLQDQGKYKIHVTVSIVKYTDDVDIINRLNDKTLGKWRVIINKNANRDNIGPVAIADPTVHLAMNVWAFVVDNYEQAIVLKDYLTKPQVNAILKQVKCSICNSTKFLRYIESPFED